MSNVTYKCPSCGAYLEFKPDSQKWGCPFCGSVFNEGELLDKDEQLAREAQAEQEQHEESHTESGAQVIYNCPSCGSQIMTDETTVATNCYYCHNPVVLQGKLTNDMRPDSVLTFSIDKAKAKSTFMEWVRKKRYVPSGFFNESSINSMQGVYYPHFITDCEVDGTLDGEGRNTQITDTAKYIITTTEHYHVRRRGTLNFRTIMRPALSKVNKKLTDGIHPFPLDDIKPFSGAYLSGFLAERRDIDKESIAGDIKGEVERYVKPLLEDTTHYNSFSGNSTADIKKLDTKYVLLPTWVLTYPNPKDPKDPYYYAMNGRTGEVCGKLPISGGKLARTALLIGAGVLAVCLLASYFLF